jgi:hypothetical protein
VSVTAARFGYQREGVGDPMIRTAAEIALEPIKVVVEFDQAEFKALNKRARYDSPADYLKLLALRELSG